MTLTVNDFTVTKKLFLGAKNNNNVFSGYYTWAPWTPVIQDGLEIIYSNCQYFIIGDQLFLNCNIQFSRVNLATTTATFSELPIPARHSVLTNIFVASTNTIDDTDTSSYKIIATGTNLNVTRDSVYGDNRVYTTNFQYSYYI